MGLCGGFASFCVNKAFLCSCLCLLGVVLTSIFCNSFDYFGGYFMSNCSSFETLCSSCVSLSGPFVSLYCVMCLCDNFASLQSLKSINVLVFVERLYVFVVLL